VSAKKNVLGCTALLLGTLLLGAGLIAAILFWPVYFDPEYTLPIEGQVVDAVTGEPVAKVLVTSDWSFERPAFVDSYGWGEIDNAATDDSGRFAIPAHKITKPWSHFFEQTLQLRHPLYDFETLRIRLHDKVENGRSEGGRILVTVEIMKLVDRFTKPEDDYALSVALRGKSPHFFEFMRERFGVTYDLPSIMETWRLLAHRFPKFRNGQNNSLAVYEYNVLEMNFRSSGEVE